MKRYLTSVVIRKTQINIIARMAIIEKTLTIANVEEDVNDLNSHMVLVSL